MVDPMNFSEMHRFREEVARMTSDDEPAKGEMIDGLGKSVGPEIALSVARLDQRPLMKG